MEIIKRSLEGFIEEYVSLLSKSQEPSEKVFIRYLLKKRPVQSIVLETLGKLTPYFEDRIGPGKYQKHKPTAEVFRTRPAGALTASTQQLMQNVTSMRSQMGSIQNSFEEFRDLDLKEVSSNIFNCFSQNQERGSQQV